MNSKPNLKIRKVARVLNLPNGKGRYWVYEVMNGKVVLKRFAWKASADLWKREYLKGLAAGK